jgi:large subunit ribosomal protein L7/L12
MSPFRRAIPRLARSLSTQTQPHNPNIPHLVDTISNLSLLQAADLVSLLKSRLGVQDIPLAAALPPQAVASTAGASADVSEAVRSF